MVNKNPGSETSEREKRLFNAERALWKFGRGILYTLGIISWGLAIGGVGRLAAFIISEIRERDLSHAAIVYDPATKSLRAALLLSPPLEVQNADAERPPASPTETM